jgi:oxidase EvaA
MGVNINVENEFLKSSMTMQSSKNSIGELISWIKRQNEIVDVKVDQVPFESLRSWAFDDRRSALRHVSGKFFSIEGIRVATNWGEIDSWDQPIINQAEIGYLGFITKMFDGVLHILLQAKVEPGNVNCVQLSPTLQATKSNYSRTHNGKSPDYLDYFINAGPEQVLVDQLQSEQGARFLKKRNRNIIIKVYDEIPIHENFTWATIGQVKALMSIDNLVNMDTRTVLAGIPYGNISSTDSLANEKFSVSRDSFEFKVLKSVLVNRGSFNTLDGIISFVTSKKAFYELSVTNIGLSDVRNWIVERDVIRHIDNRYFKIIGVEVSISNREIVQWSQPMVQPAQEGICAFVCKEINGILHFIVQVKLECGNFDIIEFAPTVQCLTGNYRHSKEGAVYFLDYVLKAPKDRRIIDTFQSEEGGRFFKEQNRNMIVFADDELSIELPDNYIWMTLNQLQTFIRYNNYINIQARSLIAALRFV